MDIYKILIATIVSIVALPACIGIMSFVMWQNGFKIIGWPFIARMSFVCSGLLNLAT